MRRRSRNPVDEGLMHQVEFSRSGANAHAIVNLASVYKGAVQTVDRQLSQGKTPDPYFVKAAKFYEGAIRRMLAGATPTQIQREKDEFERTAETGENPMPQLTIASNPGRRGKRRGRRARVAKISYRGKRTTFIGLYAKLGRKASAIWRKARRSGRRTRR